MDHESLRRVYNTLIVSIFITLILIIVSITFDQPKRIPLTLIGFVVGLVLAVGILYINRPTVNLTILTPEEVAGIKERLSTADELEAREAEEEERAQELDPCIGFSSVILKKEDEDEEDE